MKKSRDDDESDRINEKKMRVLSSGGCVSDASARTVVAVVWHAIHCGAQAVTQPLRPLMSHDSSHHSVLGL